MSEVFGQLREGAHIHLMGICGTAMASLAGILKEMGFHVTGSDQNVYPPMSTQLKDLGIDIMQGYKASNLMPPPDLVVVGNVISKKYEEAQALLASDIPYTSLPKAMGEMAIGDRPSIVVSGTHGKTTTTAMMAWVAEVCGIDAGFLIGGIPQNFSRSFRAAKNKAAEGSYFIIEGDEYDTAFFDKVPKFIHYKPRHVIFTSLEFDHIDIYQNLEEIRQAFVRLLRMIPEDGTLVACAEDPEVMALLSETSCRNIITYGLNSGTYRAVNRETVAGRNQFAVEYNPIETKGASAIGRRVADIALKQFGVHNTLNALAVFALADFLKWPRYQALQGLASFQGVKRRQEIIGDVGGVKVIEDFAHHPTAVKLTIESMREMYPQGRVLAVFEPRSATSRRNVFQQDYIKALLAANIAFIAEAFDTSKIKEEERFSSQKLVEDIRSQGGLAEWGVDADDLVAKILTQVRSGDVVLLMSNGGFGGIYQKLLSGLTEKHQSTPQLP